MAATYRDTIVADAPVSYWRLGESSGTSAADAVGGRPGTYTGPAFTLGQTGALGVDPDKALRCAGNEYVNVPAAAVLDNLYSAFSVECWVKVDVGSSGFQGFVEKTVGGAVNTQWLLYRENGYARFRVVYGGSIAYVIWDSAPLPEGSWQHLVGTFDGVTARLYRGGVQTGSVAVPGVADHGSGALRIGQLAYLPYALIGVIDEVAVYGTALSAAKVAAHYNAASAATLTVAPLPQDAATTLLVAAETQATTLVAREAATTLLIAGERAA